jgi:Ca-activated chloride channel family protein
MSQFSFEFPYIFLLLPIILLCLRRCPARSFAVYFPYIHILISKKAFKSRWSDLIKWLGIVSFLIALASPVVITKYENVNKDARDIMLVLDSSKSMLDKGFDDNDIMKTKFRAIIEVIENFIKERKSDRIGIINFASSAFIVSPLTFDKKYLLDILRRQKVGIIGGRTAIYDATLQALYLLSKSKAKSRILIILTDGSDNMSKTPFNELLNILKKNKIKVYTIGVGDERELEVDKLKKLAEAGDGKFFLANNKDMLQKIYKEIDKSETTKIKVASYQVYTYFYYFPLIIAIVSFIVLIYLRSVKGVTK